MKIFNNFGYKLAALLIAFVLWAAVQGFRSEELNLDLPIVLEDIPEGVVVVAQSVTKINVKLEGSRVELAVNVQQSAAPQVFKNPGTAATLSLSILDERASFGGLAIGSLTWNLTELAPRAVNIDAEVIKGVTYRPSPGKKAVSVAVKTDRAVNVIEK